MRLKIQKDGKLSDMMIANKKLLLMKLIEYFSLFNVRYAVKPTKSGLNRPNNKNRGLSSSSLEIKLFVPGLQNKFYDLR